MMPHLDARLAREATETRAKLRTLCGAFLEDRRAQACPEAAVEGKGNAKKCDFSAFVTVAKRYVALSAQIHAHLVDDPAGAGSWSAQRQPQQQARRFQWRVALFGGGTGDVPETMPNEVSVVYGDVSFLFERTCAHFALVAALQGSANTCTTDTTQATAHLRAAGETLSLLRLRVLPLFRATHGEARAPHVFSPELAGALQCAVTGQLFVAQARALLRKNQPGAAWLLFRALQMFQKSCAAMPQCPSLETSRRRARAFAFGAVADAVLQETGEAGVAEACMALAEGSVRGAPGCETLHGVFVKRFDAAAQQNKYVFGCMRVPEGNEITVQCHGSSADAAQGTRTTVAVTRDEQGAVSVELRATQGAGT